MHTDTAYHYNHHDMSVHKAWLRYVTMKVPSKYRRQASHYGIPIWQFLSSTKQSKARWNWAKAVASMLQQTKHVRCQMIIISVCAITEQISPTKYAQHSQHNHVYGKTPNLLFTSAPCWRLSRSRCHAHWGAYLGQVTASHNNGGAFVIRIRLILTEWLLSVLHFFRCVVCVRKRM